MRPDWTRLAELGFKPDKRLRDRITAGLQGVYDAPPIGWRPLLERYVEQEARIHVHLRRRSSDECSGLSGYPYLPNYAELCATFEWPDGALFEDLKREPELGRLGLILGKGPDRWTEAVEARERANDVWVAVLVDAPEFVQNGELVPVRGALPTTKRLQPLEVCKQDWINGPEGASADLRPFSLVYDDGEAHPPPRIAARQGVFGWRSSVEIAKAPHKMIEGGAEVVDDIADDAAETFVGFSEWSRIEREFPWDDIHVALDLEGVQLAVAKGPTCPFERADVYVRPTDPFERTREAGHGR